MSYILRTVRPAALQSWIAANAPGSLKATARESWRAYLAANSGNGQSLQEMEANFLTALSKFGGTQADRWGQQLSAGSGSKGPEKARNTYK
jgi:hypothetical protein